MSDPLFSVKDHVVLVSGGSRGIGRAIAAGFARRGARVVITGRQQDTLNQTAREISQGESTVQTLVCDVLDGNRIEEVVEEIVGQYGQIDTLVNVAGINQRKPAIDYTEDEYDHIMGVNLKGAFVVSQQVGRHMLQRGSGSQINISSLNSHRTVSHLLPYALSKIGMDQMTRALAMEWGQAGVRVNAIGPGFVETDLTRKVWQDKTMEDWRAANTPQRRIGKPEDMVGTALFLASPASAYLTGQVIYVDGGMTAGRMWPFSA